MSVFFYQPGLPEGKCFLESDEAHHCSRVLRKRTGDQIHVMDGKGSHYLVRLTSVKAKQCDFEILETTNFSRDPYIIHLAISPTKNTDRIEWMTEKCVELGLHKITLITSDHSERKSFRMDRLRKKMIAAMKQSQQPFAPELTETIIPFREFIKLSPDNEQIIMAHISEESPAEHLKDVPLNRDTCVVIGPEGDFSEREIEWALSMGVKPVSLGPHRLRTETAGLAAAHMQLLKMQ